MEVKLIDTKSLIPGMMSADDIFNSQGLQLATCDNRLTDIDITRLRFHGIEAVPIFWDSSSSYYLDNYTSDSATYFEKLSQTLEYSTYLNQFTDVVSSFEKMTRSILESSDAESDSIDDQELVASIHGLLDLFPTGNEFVDMLHTMRSYDDITYAHSVNVALICAIMGQWLNYSEEDIQLLIRCGIYHDVGKLLIPKSVVEKPAALTPEEYNLMKTHTLRGYNILRKKHLDKRILDCAMLHHERCDGSGYPLSITGNEMDTFSQILAIADVYEAMTSPRVYRKSKSPFEVIHFFEADGHVMYNQEYLEVFTSHISTNYNGCLVLLSDGQIGKITSFSSGNYACPIVTLEDDRLIDLKTTPSIHIEKIF